MTFYNAIARSHTVDETLENLNEAIDLKYKVFGLKQQTDRWDIRDVRVVAQRAYYYLRNIEVCDARLLTKRNKMQIAYLHDFIEACKIREAYLRKNKMED